MAGGVDAVVEVVDCIVVEVGAVFKVDSSVDIVDVATTGGVDEGVDVLGEEDAVLEVEPKVVEEAVSSEEVEADVREDEDGVGSDEEEADDDD